MHLRASLRAVLLALAGMAFLAPCAFASGGIGLRADGTAGSRLVDGMLLLDAAPGSTAAGHLFVTNSGTSAVQLHVDPVDGRTGRTSGLVFASRDEAQSRAGAWITLSAREITLAPGEERRIDLSAAVPAGAPRGDHVAGVAVEQRRGSNGITQVIRNVLPVRIDAGAPAAPQAGVRGMAIGTLAGTDRSAVTVRLEGAGRRLCRPTLSVRVQGPGERAAPLVQVLGTILPGDEIPYPVIWPRALKGARYTVTATATGCGAASQLERQIALADNSDTPTPAATPTVSSGSAPTPTRRTAPKPDEREPLAASRPDAGAVQGPVGPARPSALVKPESTGVGAALRRAAEFVREQAPAVLVRLAPPLILLILALLFLLAQASIDRRDPRLVRAPRAPEPDLRFLPAAQAAPPLQSIRRPTL